jgi:4-hydroxybenzoate polyprenyltransferase
VKILSDENKNITLGQILWGRFILTRPQQLIWLDVFGTMAFFAIIARKPPNAHFILFILTAVISDAGACTLNDVGDVDSDCKSKEASRSNRPLCKGVVTKRQAMIQGVILSVIGLSIALYLDIYVFLAAAALVFISFQYSMKPLKMDGRPVISQMFWISFALLYFLAISAYLRRYEDVPMENVYNGLYFIAAMILFMAVGETLAKDLRDLENDRLGGKKTTPVHFGPKSTAAASFVFSIVGMLFWAWPYFMVFETHIVLQVLVILLIVAWQIICFRLTRDIYRKYTKDKARKLHKGFILTFTCIMTLSFIGGIV